MSAGKLCESVLRAGPHQASAGAPIALIGRVHFGASPFMTVLCVTHFQSSCAVDGQDALLRSLRDSPRFGICLRHLETVGRQLENALAVAPVCLGGWEAGNLWRLVLCRHTNWLTYFLSYKAKRMATHVSIWGGLVCIIILLISMCACIQMEGSVIKLKTHKHFDLQR